jgi:hypothetical protein
MAISTPAVWFTGRSLSRRPMRFGASLQGFSAGENGLAVTKDKNNRPARAGTIAQSTA